MELWPLEGSAALQTWSLPSPPRCACVLFVGADEDSARRVPPAVAVGCADGSLAAVYPGVLRCVRLFKHNNPIR